ncbi:hypothetical protein DL770_007914 [Monosporascus sp. CRB-9-2]|nr:hypothetical protein DL770_007914 [Monosporascus sp. CRB-9-2]
MPADPPSYRVDEDAPECQAKGKPQGLPYSRARKPYVAATTGSYGIGEDADDCRQGESNTNTLHRAEHGKLSLTPGKAAAKHERRLEKGAD